MNLRFSKTAQGIILYVSSEDLYKGVQITDLIKLFECLPKEANLYRIEKDFNGDEVKIWISFACEAQLIKRIEELKNETAS